MLVVLRYLRFERNILHRDVSQSNILYTKNVEDESTSITHVTPDARSLRVNEENPTKELPLSFIKYLLDERCVGICSVGQIVMLN